MLAVVVAIYSVLEFAVGPAQIGRSLDLPVVDFTLGSQERIHLLVSDAFVLAIFALLLGEIIKSASTGLFAFMDQALSIVIAVICVYSFLFIAGFGTTVFLYITAATIFDVVSHFYIGSRIERHMDDHAAL